jgi:predicted GIY-YIG superfamily endonuclease
MWQFLQHPRWLASQELHVVEARLAHFHPLRPAAPGYRHCLPSRMPENKRFVYVLKSAHAEAHFYIGLTSDVRARLIHHNAGRCPHTARHRPWQLHVTIELPDERRAIEFERYLKSGSGRAFARRHFG